MYRLQKLCVATGLVLMNIQAGVLAQVAKEEEHIIPVQVSILPGISTSGSFSMRYTPVVSLNVFGGYTRGVKAVELAGLFNMNRKDVQYVQAAGIVNITRGQSKGVQLSGIFNSVGKSDTGVQVSGIANYTQQMVTGVQLAGINNFAGGHVAGLQVAGICNYSKSIRGIQLAGIANINNGQTKGLQIAGIINRTRYLKGVQIGLINIADSSNGYSLGLINIVKKGYHKIALTTNETVHYNVAIKTGSRQLYNILLVGINGGSTNKVFTYGYGVGREIKAGRRFTINPELTCQHLYLGNWDRTNLLGKLNLQCQLVLNKNLNFFAGPSFAVYYSDQTTMVKGYRLNIPSSGYHTFNLWNKNVQGFIGWSAGINIL